MFKIVAIVILLSSGQVTFLHSGDSFSTKKECYEHMDEQLEQLKEALKAKDPKVMVGGFCELPGQDT